MDPLAHAGLGVVIDDIDKAIIRELQVDGRLPYAKLGPAVGLSQAAARQRVQRLIEQGAMQVVAVTDPVMLGVPLQAMLGVNVEDNPEGAKKWLEENGPVTFPVLLDPKHEVSKLYKVQTMPTTVLVARDGTMRFIHHGYKPGYEGEYQTQVRALLKE